MAKTTRSTTGARAPGRQTGKRPARTGARPGATRRTRRPKNHWVGPVVTVAILAAAIVYGPTAYKRLRSIYDAKQEARREAKESGGTETEYVYKTIRKPSSGTSSKEAAPPPENEGQKEEYLALVLKGKARYAAGDFAEAAAAFDEAGSLAVPMKQVEKARTEAKKAELFAALTEGIEPSVEADATSLYWIELKGGGRFRAKVLKETAGQVHVRKDNGISSVFPRERIASMTPIGQEERTRELREALLEAKLKAERNGLAYYLLAKQALESGLPEEATELLEEAHAVDPELDTTVREHFARKIFKTAAWFQAADMKEKAKDRFERLFARYPGTRAAKLAREILAEAKQEGRLAYAAPSKPAAPPAEAKPTVVAIAPEEEEEEEADSEDVARRFASDIESKDAATVEKGNIAFRTGMELVAKARDADTGQASSKYYHQAEKHLKTARDFYGKALDKDPDNADLQRRLQQVSEQFYWCRKMMRL